MEISPRQLKVVNKLIRNNGGAIFWRVGTGKTRIALGWFATIAKEIEAEMPFPRFLVVCRREAFFDWQNEKDKLGLKWRTREVETEDDLYSIRTKKPVLYLISHGKLARMLLTLKECSSIIYAVVFDEGFLFKNPSTEHCKSANHLSAMIGRAAILSGSVMTARDLTDVFGQLYAINSHHRLARTLTEFRSRFMLRFAINPNSGSKASRFVAQRGAAKRVTERILPVTSFYFPDNNQRRIVTDVKTLPPTRDQLQAFRELKEFYELELRGSRIELKNAPSVITKCQQISDGWVKMEEQTLPVSTRKMEYLLSKTSELVSSGEKIVIWCAFRHTVDLILQALQKRKIKAYGMSGDHKFDIAGWISNGEVAVATVASGSSINHFKNCAYAIYYSHSFHWLHMQQSQGRTNRHDSLHQTCFYYFLQVEGSLDSMVYQTVKSSKGSEASLIEQATKEVNKWLLS